MLRITQNNAAAAAVKYFDEGLSKSDYYSAKNEIIGIWGGKGATALGLNVEVSREDFHKLCYNINPQTDERLTARNDTNRTIGYDFTFSVPKSVSIIYSQTRDPDILKALNTAISSTMQDIEVNAETRVRKNNAMQNRTTGNLTWAAFTHEDARPVDGIPDPHLHQHVFVFNATHDPQEKQWKAGQFRNIKATATYYEALFNNHLAHELQKAGYALERGAYNFEVAGFERSTIEKFSNRTLEVNRKAEELGLEFAEDKAKVGAQTRANKRTGLDKQSLQELWTERLTDQEKNLIQEAKNKNRPSYKPDMPPAKAALDYSLAHTLERKSVVEHNELMTLALKHSMGSVSKEELEQEIKDRSDLLSREVGKKVVYTNTRALHEEKRLIEAARSGRKQLLPLNPNFEPQNAQLNKEQRAAILHALNSRDFITLISGAAGAGKTWTMKEIAAGSEKAGTNFHAFAPSSAASRDVQRKEGFEQATTVASLLIDKNLQEQVKNGVIWIDEAGLLGCPTLNEVVSVAKNQNARLLLSGDTRQHTGVERGDAMRILQKYGGIKPAMINTIQRQQKEVYKDAVKALSEGHIEKGFKTLNTMGAIKESTDFDSCVNALADEYVTARKARESVLVVATTHKQGQAATHAIRSKLKENGKLAKKEKLFPTQVNLSLTDAQKQDRANYQSGQSIQFHQNLKGFVRGEIYDVTGRDNEGNILLKSGNTIKTLPVQAAKSFSVYQKNETGLAKGDIIRVTQNGFSQEKKRLSNGNILHVKGFDDNGNILASTGQNDITIDKNYRNFAHGYYTTSPASQGKSVNRVLVLQTMQSGKATSKEQFYVSVSRGKFGISVHTDNKAELLDSVQRSSTRMSATEMLSKGASLQRTKKIREKLKEIEVNAPQKQNISQNIKRQEADNTRTLSK